MTILPEKHGAPEACPVDNDPAAVDFSAAAPFVGSDFSEEDYLQIGSILKEAFDFDLSGYKDLCIKRRIAARIRASGLNAAEPYIELLRATPSEQQSLLAALTIHVSQFFRNNSTFAVLEKKVLPELLQRARQRQSKLRIWSVGCASGEEPYSLALLCHELRREGDQLTIVATDLSSGILQQAKRGLYARSRLAGVPERVLQSYFQPQDERYQLCAEIRETVRFFRHDILNDKPFYRADLILCRNLLIYFSREQQKQILRTLAGALPAGGYLVLGRAETLVSSDRELFRCIDPAERIYQRLPEAELSATGSTQV